MYCPIPRDPHPRRKARFHSPSAYSVIDDSTYSAAFYPDAPSQPPLAPAAARATPYVVEPTECTINFRTGTIRCVNNESHGGLYPAPVLHSPRPRRAGPPAYTYPQHAQHYSPRVTHRQPVYGGYPPTNNFNHVYGEQIVDERSDSPLNRILTRQPTGPWKLVGTAITDSPTDSQSRDRTMMVYSQSVDTARDRYNYRVVDSNNVPLDLEEKVHWKTDDSSMDVPGQSAAYKLKLYNQYK